MKKIVIACDSFKGSLSSMEIADSAEKGIRNVFPDCEVVKIPVADGGEGLVDALVAVTGGEKIRCTVLDPLRNPIEAEYGISGDRRKAFIEMAAASGLPLVPEEKRNPMLTTTYGTGQLIRDALLRGCRQFLVGIGGSATNDAGIGMLQALGFRFRSGYNAEEFGGGGKLLSIIENFDSRKVMPEVLESTFIVACDVNNPFSGPKGAAHVYARQKGADDEMIAHLDKGLKHFAATIKKVSGKDIDKVPGAGAAGGMGGGFLAFLDATLKPGIEVVLEAFDFEANIRDADLIITGEGKLDRQTGMGKAPAGVLKVGLKHHIPVIAIGGAVEDIEKLNKLGFTGVFPVQPGPVSLEEAMKKPFASRNIERTVGQIVRLISMPAAGISKSG